MLSCYLKLKDWVNAFNCLEVLINNNQEIFIFSKENRKSQVIINNLGVSLYHCKEYNKSKYIFELLNTQANSDRLDKYWAFKRSKKSLLTKY